MLGNFREKFLLETIVFVSGALVMIFEVTGSRLLAPFIGTSTYVWTSLIGVILGSLSLGYWLGGRVADRQPNPGVLAGVLFAAAGLLSLTILLHAAILSVISAMPFGLEIKSIVAALLLFAPASVLFGFVTPYVVRLKMSSVEDAGKTVGRLYALSTVGSITGTFLAGFFLLPFVGSLRTLYVLAAILFALSLLIAPFRLSRVNLFAVVLFPVAILFNEAYGYILFQSVGLRDFDTEYNRLQIFRTAHRTDKRPMLALATDPASTQSAMYLDSDELALKYSHFYHLLRHFKPDFEHTLIVGGAAYSFPKNYLKTYPGKKIDVVEIDPRMTRLAREFFRLEDHPDLQIFHEDGRVFLNRVEPRKYDVILIDAFGSLFSVPFQLTTLEAVQKMNEATTENGLVILNMVSAIEGEGSLFMQAEYETYRRIFPHVYLFQVSKIEPVTIAQNVILVASKNPNISFATGDAEILALLENRLYAPLNFVVPPLTDDRAPVEYYNSLAQKHAAK